MNNTDLREALELAALACGWKWHLYDSESFIDRDGPEWEKWDPINDDGDSRRLQVALGIDLVGSVVSCVWNASSFNPYITDSAEIAGDSPAAARLAILRVAAEIGRRIKAERERAK